MNHKDATVGLMTVHGLERQKVEGDIESLTPPEDGELLPQERKILGTSQLEEIPLVRMNLLSQVRQSYDQEGIDELARSMIVPDGEGGFKIDVIHNPTLARLTRDQAISYIEKINTVFHASHTIDELVPLGPEAKEHKDKYIIVIAGHRRRLAIYRAAEIIGEDPRSLDIVSNVIDGDKLTFSTAISIQYRENFHRRPESWEDAFAVDAIYQEGIKSGEYKSFKDCAAHLSIDPDRVARAYRFQTLPEHIRDRVRDKNLPFGKAILLTRLFPILAYIKCKGNLTEDERELFRRKIDSNRLYLPDIIPYLNDEQQSYLRNDILFFADKIESPGLRKMHKAEESIDQTIKAIFDEGSEYSLRLNSESYGRGTAEKALRVDQRDLVVGALRHIAAVVESDRMRKLDGRLTVFSHSANVKNALAAIERYNREMNKLSEDDIEAIEKLTASTLGAVGVLIADADRDAELTGSGLDALLTKTLTTPPQEDSIF